MKHFIISLTLLFILSSMGTVPQGTVRVVVFDDENGDALIGANVVLEGTTTGAVTDLDGKASITGLQAGTYNLVISYVSYEPTIIKNVEVDEKNPVVLNVRLQPASFGLEEVVVEAQLLRNSESALLTAQKKSMVLLDAVSAEQFSRNGDGNAAAALRRVTGVSVEGGKHIYVRGLGDRYSITNLNGATVPGLDPNKNSVQLDIFPSNLIDNIVVYKTFSPELPGNFTGGLVDVVTKDFPDRFTLQFSGGVGYNSQANFNPQFLTSNKSKTDPLGFDDGLRAKPEALNGFNANNFPAPYIDNQELDRLTKSFKHVSFDNEQNAPFLNHGFSASIGNQYNLFGDAKIGYVSAISYDRDFEYYQNGFTGRYSAGAGAEQLIPEMLLDDARGTENVLLSGLLNTTLKINNFNKIKINTLYNQSGTNFSRNQYGVRARPDINPNRQFENRSLGYIERSMMNIQVGGEHTLPFLNNLSVKWLSSYTLSDQDEPDLRFFANNINIQPDGSIRYGFDAATARRPSRYFRNLEENNHDNHLDFILPIKAWGGREAKIKFGGAYTTKARSFREDRFEYFLSNNISFTGDMEAFLSDQNLGLRGEGKLGHYLTYATELRNNYDADQIVSAGYLSTELLLSKKLHVNGGIRMEITEIHLESFDSTEGKIEEADFLPALGLKFSPVDNMNLRASYTRTLARPTFREIAPLATFDFIGGYIQLGNPELARTLIDNFDFRWEFYPRPEEYLSVGTFYKNFKNPIENAIVPESGSTDGEFKYMNVDQAIVYGIEIEARKSLDFISQVLSDFKIGANITLVHSEVDIDEGELKQLRVFIPEAEPRRRMYNQSPYIINANLTYNNSKSKWNGNLTYNVFGERLSYVSSILPYVYEQPKPDLDLSIGKGIGDRVMLKIRATNLLNPDFKQAMVYKGKEYIFQQYNLGRTFSLGFSYVIE